MAIAPQDADAFKCKIIAFIKLNQFGDVLSLLESPSTDKKLLAELGFERAYCLYRTRKFEEALDVIKSIPGASTVRAQELEAQVVCSFFCKFWCNFICWCNIFYYCRCIDWRSSSNVFLFMKIF